MLTTIGFSSELRNAWENREFGLVGVCPWDKKVYVWLMEETVRRRAATLSLWRCHPVVPDSWERLREFYFPQRMFSPVAQFNLDGTEIAFHYFNRNIGSGRENLATFFTFNLLTEEEKYVKLEGFIEPIIDGNQMMFSVENFGDTSLGWLAASWSHYRFGQNRNFKAVWRMLDNNTVNPELLTVIAGRWEEKTVFTKDALYQLDKNGANQFKLIKFSFEENEKTEFNFTLPFELPENSELISIFGSFESPYLIVHDGTCNLIFRIEIDSNTVHLWPVTRVEGEYLLPNTLRCGEGKLVITQRKKGLTVVELSVPSLKYLSIRAVQLLFGIQTDDGLILGGISEPKLRQVLGYKSDKKLFE